MRIHERVLNALVLADFATEDIKKWRERFPPLIMERCLEEAGPLLGKHIFATFSQEAPLLSEVITMPRSGFGPRPILITTPSARILYSALTSSLEDAFSTPTRGLGKWDDHMRFGLDGHSDYIIDLDIASYYEYIDHNILQKELILRSMRPDTTQALIQYLTEILGRPRGLPQMLSASDRLADTYLSILDRKMARDGYNLSRYVDDMRLTARDWASANETIERVAEYLRDLGLILSSGKTGIYKKQTVIDQDREVAEFYEARYREMRYSLSQIMFASPYGEDEIEIEPEERETALATAHSMLAECGEFFKTRGPDSSLPRPLQQFIGPGLYALRSYEARIPDRLLIDLTFHDPRRIEHIAKYLVARTGQFPHEPNIRSIERIAFMGRQSAWSRLWLLHAIEQVDRPYRKLSAKLSNWVRLQLSDRHEVVRAQAAWLSAELGVLTADQLTQLYSVASEITHPALAACVARQGNISKSTANGIVSDSPLNREAFEWAERLKQ